MCTPGLAHSGCCSKIPQTVWLITIEIHSSAFRRLGSPDWGAGRFSTWWGPASWFIAGVLSMSSQDRRGQGARWSLFYKGINEAPPSWPNHLPNALPPNTITLGITISTYELGGWGVQTFSNPSVPFKCCTINVLASENKIPIKISLPLLPKHTDSQGSDYLNW